MRSFALSEEFLARGYSAHFIVNTPAAELLARLSPSKISPDIIDFPQGDLEDLKRTTLINDRFKSKLIILDGYNFGESYQAQLRERNSFSRILVFDDGVIDGFDCDFILNQNLGAEKSSLYSEVKGSKLLLGSGYTSFRMSLRHAAKKNREIRRYPDNILLTFGGADPNNLCITMLRGLVSGSATRNYCIRVLLGGANRNQRTLGEISLEARQRVELLPFTTEIVDHLLWADLVVSAAGGTAWELALLQNPMALLVAADNQRIVAQALAEHGAAEILGDFRDFNPDTAAARVDKLMRDYDKRRELSLCCKAVIDQNGATRVVDAIEEL